MNVINGIFSDHTNPKPHEILSREAIGNMELMAEAITRIHIRIDTQKKPDIYDWQGSTRLALSRLKGQSISFFVRLNDELVGYAIMRNANPSEMPPTHKPEEKGQYLSFIALEPAYNRNGMGKALMTTMRKQAKTSGNDYLILDHRGYDKLNSFYEGFKRGTHMPKKMRTYLNPETGEEETHRTMRVIFQLKNPNKD